MVYLQPNVLPMTRLDNLPFDYLARVFIFDIFINYFK